MTFLNYIIMYDPVNVGTGRGLFLQKTRQCAG
jgi:hypothetical protein